MIVNLASLIFDKAIENQIIKDELEISQIKKFLKLIVIALLIMKFGKIMLN